MAVPGQDDLIPGLRAPNQLHQLTLGIGHGHLHGLSLYRPSGGLMVFSI